MSPQLDLRGSAGGLANLFEGLPSLSRGLSISAGCFHGCSGGLSNSFVAIHGSFADRHGSSVAGYGTSVAFDATSVAGYGASVAVYGSSVASNGPSAAFDGTSAAGNGPFVAFYRGSVADHGSFGALSTMAGRLSDVVDGVGSRDWAAGAACVLARRVCREGRQGGVGVIALPTRSVRGGGGSLALIEDLHRDAKRYARPGAVR